MRAVAHQFVMVSVFDVINDLDSENFKSEREEGRAKMKKVKGKEGKTQKKKN